MVRRSASAPMAICALLLLGAGPVVAERTQARKAEDAHDVLTAITTVPERDAVHQLIKTKEIDKPSDVLKGASLSDPPSAAALRRAVESWEKGR